MSQRKTLVVAGHGMVGHRFVQAAIERGLTERYDVVVVGEEPRPAYDRVALTSFFDAGSADELSLLPEGRYDDPRVRLLLSTTVAGLDRDAPERTALGSFGHACPARRRAACRSQNDEEVRAESCRHSEPEAASCRMSHPGGRWRDSITSAAPELIL